MTQGNKALATERITKIVTTVEHYRESGMDVFMARDLLTDVRHFCDKVGISFQDALAGSYDIYIEEDEDDRRHGLI